MILEIILNSIKNTMFYIFWLLPDIPDIEISLLESLTQYINLIFDNLGLLPFFINISTIKALVPLIILVINFEHVYHFIMWVVKKIPVSIE